MFDAEAETWKRAGMFYVKWRSVILETDGQWAAFTEDACRLWEDLDAENNPLGKNLFFSLLDTFNDLYRGGMKPMPANYFGRDDL